MDFSFAYTPIVLEFGIMPGTERTLYIKWQWDMDFDTDYYLVKWCHHHSRTSFIVEQEIKQPEEVGPEYMTTFDIPEDTEYVTVDITPYAIKKTVNNTEVYSWIASASDEEVYDCDQLPVADPMTPQLKMDNGKVTGKLTNIPGEIDAVEFRFVVDDRLTAMTDIKYRVAVSTRNASMTINTSPGKEYKVQCRYLVKRHPLTSSDIIGGYNLIGYDSNYKYSVWSDFSDSIKSVPVAPKSILECSALNESSVRLRWEASGMATSYIIEYTTKAEYFDKTTQVQSQEVINRTDFNITGLATGTKYYFRVCAKNESGNSSYTPIKNVTLGRAPSSPSTWSSTTTAMVGEDVTLYWIHNSEDGSSQTWGQVEMTINGKTETVEIQNSTDPLLKDKTSHYTIPKSKIQNGAIILWRVRTSGVMAKKYGEWSIQRQIDVYEKPYVTMTVEDSIGQDVALGLKRLPIVINAVTGPSQQRPLSYIIDITSNESYESFDVYGEITKIREGQSVYYKHIDTSDNLIHSISAGDIQLQNNRTYTITCTASMDSGLLATSSLTFQVAWTGTNFAPYAEIGFDENLLVSYIKPYAINENGDRVDTVLLSVYRKEYDGEFKEICHNIDSADDTFVVDPHPALSYSNYRIVATSKITGDMAFNDIAGFQTGIKSAVIQWDETVTQFVNAENQLLNISPWSGMLVYLPYNLDITENNNKHVALVEYAGRKRPVSYYGTQLGETSSWSVEIPKDDVETLYLLRKLRNWTGDVYVREPSGVGYWANVSVSFSRTHLAVTIPVSIEITRVEGGA